MRSWASQLELMERHSQVYEKASDETTAPERRLHEDQESYGEASRNSQYTSPRSAFLHTRGSRGSEAGSHTENWGGSIAEDRVTDMTWQFVASQAVQWEWLKEDNVELFHRVKKAVRRGMTNNGPSRCFVPIGNAYTEFDANLPSGESMVRHFLYGRSFFMQEFGREEGEMEQEAERQKKAAKEERRRRKERKNLALGIPVTEYDSADDSEDNEDEEEEEEVDPAIDFASRYATPTSKGTGKRASPGSQGNRGLMQSKRGNPSSLGRTGGTGAPTTSPGNTTTPTFQANSRYTQSTASSRGRQVDNGGKGRKDHFFKPVLYAHSLQYFGFRHFWLQW